MGEPSRGWGSAEYGDRLADVYDHWYEGLDEALPAAVDLLAKTAAGGRALELGVGTGRVALPLAQAGVRVAFPSESSLAITQKPRKTHRL